MAVGATVAEAAATGVIEAMVVETVVGIVVEVAAAPVTALACRPFWPCWRFDVARKKYNHQYETEL
jgi:hypothetical protein